MFNYSILRKNYKKKKPGKNEIVTFFGHRDKETRKKTEHPWTKIHFKINF